MTIWRKRTSPESTNTHSQYVTLNAFPLQQWLHERAAMLGYTYFACIIVAGDKFAPPPPKKGIFVQQKTFLYC